MTVIDSITGTDRTEPEEIYLVRLVRYFALNITTTSTTLHSDLSSPISIFFSLKGMTYLITSKITYLYSPDGIILHGKSLNHIHIENPDHLGSGHLRTSI